jgi:hypothetical protein
MIGNVVTIILLENNTSRRATPTTNREQQFSINFSCNLNNIQTVSHDNVNKTICRSPAQVNAWITLIKPYVESPLPLPRTLNPKPSTRPPIGQKPTKKINQNPRSQVQVSYPIIQQSCEFCKPAFFSVLPEGGNM